MVANVGVGWGEEERCVGQKHRALVRAAPRT